MQIRQFLLELDMIMRGPGNVACSTRSRTRNVDRFVHGLQDGRVLTHAEIVIRAPDGDRARSTVGELRGLGKVATGPDDVGEDAIAPLAAKLRKRLIELAFVVHLCNLGQAQQPDSDRG